MRINYGNSGAYAVPVVLVNDFGDELFLTQFDWTQEEINDIPDGAAMFHKVLPRTIHAAFDFAME